MWSDEGKHKLDEANARIAELEAELAARDERTCATCRWGAGALGCRLLAAEEAAICRAHGYNSWMAWKERE